MSRVLPENGESRVSRAAGGDLIYRQDDGPLGPWNPERAERRVITPDAAHQLLVISADAGRHNRHSGKRPVIAASIRNGNFRCNGATIALAWNAMINDGHNRLWACVDAELSIESYVVFGLDPDLFRTNDVNARSRNVSDVLCIEGNKYPNSLAAAGAMAVRYLGGERTQSILSGSKSALADVVELTAEVKELFPTGLLESCDYVTARRRDFWFLSDRAGIAGHYLFGLAHRGQRDSLFEGLRTGAGLETGDPILTLRNKLMQSPAKGGRDEDGTAHRQQNFSAYMQLQYMIRAWNAAWVGKTLVLLKVPNKVLKDRLVPDDLPEVIGLESYLKRVPAGAGRNGRGERPRPRGRDS